MMILLGGHYVYKEEIPWGGIEAVLKNLKLGFSCYEPDVQVNVASGNIKTQNIYEIYNDITYIKLPNLKLGSVFISRYPSRIKRFLNKTNFDILNDHSVDFAYYALKMNENIKNKLVLTLHGMIWEEKKFRPKYQQIPFHLIYVKRINKILKNLKYFVSISPYTREMVENRTNATIFDICNPIPDKVFKIKNHNQEKRMFYMGVISKRKNLLSLIKSLNLVRSEIKNFKLIVAGKITDKKYFDEILNYINKNNLENNVEYLGTVTEEQKFDEFSKMSFLILPSLQETAPMVISEAFAAGKAVIASNICGIPYMINNEKNGLLINPLVEKDISDKIIYLMENPDQAELMGANAKKYAERYHSLETVTKKYKKTYETVMNGNMGEIY